MDLGQWEIIKNPSLEPKSVAEAMIGDTNMYI